jgi:hypothetical protein
MRIAQEHWTEEAGWNCISPDGIGDRAQIAFVFGDTNGLKRAAPLQDLHRLFPRARIVGCSTAGEIMAGRVFDNSLTATAVCFEGTPLQFAQATVDGMQDSFDAGTRLAGALSHDGLMHVFVLSDGLNVNGSALVMGLRGKLPTDTAVTGGLAADQDRFRETIVFLDELSHKSTVVAIGLYGDALQVGYGSRGGWDSFGPDRVVTRSQANVVYKLDGQPILQLYKKYLGELAGGLPATGLLFPLSVTLANRTDRLVRTILAIDESDGSMTFAGDVPEGSLARLMKANVERLVDGAAESASQSRVLGSQTPTLAMLISCVGRKLVLKQRVEEEVEIVRDTLGPDTVMTGFYSYGEICPVQPDRKQAELHNQTMTITTFSERPA